MGYEPLKDDTKEEYRKIWTHYAVGHFTQEQLAKLFNCSQDTVANAIKWAAGRRFRFEASILAESAQEAIETKLRELNSDIIKIREKEPINWNAIIGIEKLVIYYRELLWKFQGVVLDKSVMHVVNHPYDAANEVADEINALKMSDEDRNTLSAIFGKYGRPPSED